MDGVEGGGEDGGEDWGEGEGEGEDEVEVGLEEDVEVQGDLVEDVGAVDGGDGRGEFEGIEVVEELVEVKGDLLGEMGTVDDRDDEIGDVDIGLNGVFSDEESLSLSYPESERIDGLAPPLRMTAGVDIYVGLPLMRVCPR